MAYGEFNSLPHIRVGRFIVQGYPNIDGGREHMEFLCRIYLRCKPWLEETVMYLDRGLDIAERMVEKYKEIKPSIGDSETAGKTGESLNITRLLIRTNNLYVKTIFAYFGYRDSPSPEKRETLAALTDELETTCVEFRNAPGYGYHLYGVEQLLKNARAAVENLSDAERALAGAPDSEQIEALVAKQQQQYRKVLESHKDELHKVMHWECRVDGRDILKIRGDKIEIEHLRWDGMYFKDYEILTPLPAKAVTVIPKDIESRPMHPFVLEQPNAGNGYTAKIYLYDVPGGAGWSKFDVYYIDRPPEELGLEIEWE